MMTKFSSLQALLAHPVDTIIDVRSPAEFAEDHVPGAINLPVLDNEERAEVGTIYKQVSPFRARKLGAAMVFRNAARHIEIALAHHEGGWRPLVYCWRGGQRSGAFAWMLREIGWRAEVIDGGYRSFRRMVVAAMYDAPVGLPLVRVGGLTGTAKTEILGHLAGLGAQVIDLEALANHRGSLLGARDTPQPSQKAFETALAVACARMDPGLPCIVEAESSKIGALTLPPSFWAAMKTAPILEVTAPLSARAAYLARAYEDILADTELLREKLSPLRRVRGAKTLEAWDALMEAGDKVALCRALAEDHYDPAYRRAQAAWSGVARQEVPLPDLAPDTLAGAAARILGAAQRICTAPVPGTKRPTTAAS
ncbi:MAG: tRNA 2-selenouridine(34) synthase MnmH [Pseudomonadota bacterium]